MRQLVFALSVLLSVAANASEADGVAPDPQPGWVFASPDEAALQVMPAVEALAWRYDSDEHAPTTDIWISSVALSHEQRAVLLPKRNGQTFDEATQPETLGLPGILVRVDDQGNSSEQMVDLCLPSEGGVDCTGGSGLGMVLVSHFDTESIAGTFYSRGRDGTLYAAAFDAPLRNESRQPLPGNVAWSRDGEAAGTAWLEHNAAAQSGDAAALKLHALPDRVADYDDPKIVKLVQRMALAQPKVLSARLQDSQALLWVRDSVARGGHIPGVQRVSMQLVDGQWRVYKVQLN